MQTRMARLTLPAALIALGLAVNAAAAQDTKTEPALPEAEIQRELRPKQHPVTEADIAECMKSWDPQTQMSREDYEQACRRSLKYYPEQPN